MKSKHTQQKLMNSLLGLAAASFLIASPGVFANTGMGSTETERDDSVPYEQSNGAQAQGQGLDEQQEGPGVSGAPSDIERGAAEGPQEHQDQQEQGASGAPQGSQQEGQKLDQLSQDEIQDRDVVNINGDDLGSVQEVVTGPDGEITGIVVGVGGFLGIGERDVFASSDEIRVMEDQLVWETPMDEDALTERPEYDAEDPASTGGVAAQ